jgi:flagellar biosynthesis protein FlhG
MDQAARLRALVTNHTEQVNVPGSRAHKGHTRIIAVTSGKGGVGKTTIAVNLAVLLADEGYRALIVDADLGLANVDVMLGLESPRHIGHLLLTDLSAEDVAVIGPSGVRVISGGSGLKELAEVSGANRSMLLEKLRSYYRQFDFVVVDTSPGIGDDVIDFLTDADELLLVTTPEPTSLRDTYALAKALDRKLPELKPRIVVNMASAEDARRSIDVLNEVSLKFIGRQYECRFNIESDQMASRSVHSRCVLVKSFPRSCGSVSLRRLARAFNSGLTEGVNDVACATA